MTRVRISDEALDDLNDGFWFYEAQAPGLGDYFSTGLQADINGLKVTGGIHVKVYKDYHRLLSRTFPYAIYYSFDQEEDQVVVWAIVDCRRSPDWIRKHIDPIE